MSRHRKNRKRGCLMAVFFLIAGIVALIASVWAFGAIYYNGPLKLGPGNLAVGIAWVLVTLFLLFRLRGGGVRLVAWMILFAVVLIPFVMIPASNDRDWQAQWAKTGWADIDGDKFTFHNVRNFDYDLDGSVTERWETRTVHLSNLKGVDYFQDAFGGKYIAHPMLSYDFGPDGRIVCSIETRREKGESYSEFGGLYKMFELQYLFGDERDFVRVRSNMRNEPIYLYRLDAPKERILETFLESVAVLNELKERPRFYNVITHNCTTSYRAQTPRKERRRFDIRMLINGKLDELMYERGDLATDGLPFDELRKKAFINEAAKAAQDDPEFSTRIREGRPGFGS